jgi:hypothetical protein
VGFSPAFFNVCPYSLQPAFCLLALVPPPPPLLLLLLCWRRQG